MPQNQTKREAEPQKWGRNLSESQRLSAHQAAKPRLLDLIFKEHKAELQTIYGKYNC